MAAKFEKPSDNDCCGSGCNPCIFDIYERLLQSSDVDPSTSDEIRDDLLSPLKYRPFKLLYIDKLNENTNLYVFQPFILNTQNIMGISNPELNQISGRLPYFPGQHFIMTNLKMNQVDEFTPKNLSVSRAYTPISTASTEKDCIVKFVIKFYEKGQMSSVIRQFKCNDIVYFRGAFGDFRHQLNTNYAMFSCGTGFAPLYSIIKSILIDEIDESLIHVYLAYSTLTDVLFREELRNFKKYWNFKATIYLANETEDQVMLSKSYDEDIRVARITTQQVDESINAESKILVCGSEKFCKYICNYAKEQKYKDIFVF